MTTDVLDFGGFPGRWEIIRSPSRTDGDVLEMRFEIETVPEEGPFVHLHPEAAERYAVESGVLAVNVNGTWREVTAGESLTVPPGTPHTFRNTTAVELLNTHRPAGNHEAFFRGFHRLVVEAGVSLPPAGVGDMIRLAMLTTDHDADIRAVRPPHWAFRGLASIGRLLGFDLPTAEPVGPGLERAANEQR